MLVQQGQHVVDVDSQNRIKLQIIADCHCRLDASSFEPDGCFCQRQLLEGVKSSNPDESQAGPVCRHPLGVDLVLGTGRVPDYVVNWDSEYSS